MSKILWLDLGDFGVLLETNIPDATRVWNDHGVGLLRTILHQAGVMTDIASTRAVSNYSQLEPMMRGYDTLLLNIRSYTFPQALDCARLFKKHNPNGKVIVGGMHATVALEDMTSCPEFDKICQGAGEKVIVDLVTNPDKYPRVVIGQSAKSMADWPMIDRTLWPKAPKKENADFRFGMYGVEPNEWPLEPSIGWGPPPVATMITTRTCPYTCAFCNENSYLPNMGRRSVDQVIDELNFLDKTYGPIGSCIFHDSMWFLSPPWLREWLDKYPKKTKCWPYWAAARADTVRKWPDLFEALVRETNWHTPSIGFESGSTNVLKLLNKECTAEDNYFVIDMLNRIGDDFERQGKKPPFFWTNVISGIPGETREDAFETMRMIKFIKRQMLSLSFYSPYPGSILGHQLIAEGKSYMSRTRYRDDPKVKGVDYAFYDDIMKGKYNQEIFSKPWKPVIDAGKGELSTESVSHDIFLFDLKNGKKMIGYGHNAEDALKILGMRLSELEMAQINKDSYTLTTQKKMREFIPQLGAAI